MWRYSALLPVPDGFVPATPSGMTPLLAAPRLAKRIGATNLYLKNDAVCMPTLSFKDRVVSVALAAAQTFGFDTVGCSSTGNLANAVAAQAARLGLKTYILVPADLEPAKIINTQVYGANLVRIDGNYDHVNRLCSQIADRYNWGFVNVNLRPFYAEGSKTAGYEIAEQLGWRLPDNMVVPMAGGSLITKIRKAFSELIELGSGRTQKRALLRSAGNGLLADCPSREKGAGTGRAATAQHHCPLACHRQPGRWALRGARHSSRPGGWAEDVSDVEIVSAMQELAETEGVFTETAGGVTTAVTARLYAHGRIAPGELTVMMITGNGLKTTDALEGRFEPQQAIRPRLADFEEFVERNRKGKDQAGKEAALAAEGSYVR